MKIDVLVVTPPSGASLARAVNHNHPPVNQGIDSVPLRLASVIEEQFVTDFLPLNFLDYNYYKLCAKSLLEIIKSSEPKVVVFSTDYHISNRSTACVNATVGLSDAIKASNQNIKIIVTGKHAIVCPEDFIYGGSSIDIAVTSEAELIINDLIRSAANKDKLETIPNLCYLENNCDVKYTYTDKTAPNYDLLPVPAYHLLRNKMDMMLAHISHAANKVYLTLRTSCGCVYNCPFCGGISNWNNYRMRSAKNVELDITHAKKNLGPEAEFTFLDDELFTYSIDHVEDIASIFVKNNINLMGVLTHVNYFDNNIAELISKFSRSIIFGAENFNNTILGSISKPQTYESIVHACRIAKNNKLNVRLECIIGLPMETVSSLALNLNIMYNLIASGTVDIIIPYILTPHPGTLIAKKAMDYGLNIWDYNYDHYHESFSYPVYSTQYLSSNQILVYYLFAKMVINMAQNARKRYIDNKRLFLNAEYSEEMMIELFNMINKHYE